MWTNFHISSHAMCVSKDFHVTRNALLHYLLKHKIQKYHLLNINTVIRQLELWWDDLLFWSWTASYALYTATLSQPTTEILQRLHGRLTAISVTKLRLASNSLLTFMTGSTQWTLVQSDTHQLTNCQVCQLQLFTAVNLLFVVTDAYMWFFYVSCEVTEVKVINISASNWCYSSDALIVSISSSVWSGITCQ